MHTTIYFTVSDCSNHEDAKVKVEQLLEPKCTEDNWYTIIAATKQFPHWDMVDLTTRKHGYTETDFTEQNIIAKIVSSRPIDLWTDSFNAWLFNKQGLTNKCTSDNNKYLVIVNMHT